MLPGTQTTSAGSVPPPSGSPPLYLAGTGSFAVEVAEWAEDAGWRVAGLIELLDPARLGMVVAGAPVVADASPAVGASAVVAIGGERRGHATRLQRLGWDSPAVLHPAAHISRSSVIAFLPPAVLEFRHAPRRQNRRQRDENQRDDEPQRRRDVAYSAA